MRGAMKDKRKGVDRHIGIHTEQDYELLKHLTAFQEDLYMTRFSDAAKFLIREALKARGYYPEKDTGHTRLTGSISG